MREIKFRAWNSNQNKILTHEQVQRSNVFAMQEELVPEDFILLPLQDHWKLMQYTGLKARDGKEIYEGDIVNSNYGHRYQIKWGAEGYWMADPTHREDWYFLYDYTWEIIGNIYENPELIK